MYSTTVSITEENIQGSFDYPSTPHVYKKDSETLKDAHDIIEELVWEAIEIEGLDSLKCHIDIAIEQDGKYVDHDEFILSADIIRTETPSSYVIWGDKKPHIFQIDRARSRIYTNKV